MQYEVGSITSPKFFLYANSPAGVKGSPPARPSVMFRTCGPNQSPERSGLPSGVRGVASALAVAEWVLAAGDWPAAGIANRIKIGSQFNWFLTLVESFQSQRLKLTDGRAMVTLFSTSSLADYKTGIRQVARRVYV